jgi:hypothetical protein
MDLTVPPTNDVPALKKIEKKIVQEGKAEDKTVKANLKAGLRDIDQRSRSPSTFSQDLTHVEKASHKAAKVILLKTKLTSLISPITSGCREIPTCARKVSSSRVLSQ